MLLYCSSCKDTSSSGSGGIGGSGAAGGGGGIGGGGAVDSGDGGGISGSGSIVVVGPISGFGSVLVNGIKFNTLGSTVTFKGEIASENTLQVGAIVKIKGTVDPVSGLAVASSIVFEEIVEGPVQSVNPQQNKFVVLGLTVFVDDTTLFEGTTFSSLAKDNIVEISGFADSKGDVHATRVELKQVSFIQGASNIAIKGKISSLNTANFTFALGSVTVNYQGALLKNVPQSGLADGLLVSVRSAQDVANDTINAYSVQVMDSSLGLASEEKTELEGIITRFVTLTDFDINGQRAATNSQTTYEGGNSSDIVENLKVAVKGTMAFDGTVIAKKISIRKPNKIKIKANVQAIDLIKGTVKLLGINVLVNSITILKDSSNSRDRYFGLQRISLGDHLEIAAYLDGNNIVATRLEREEADTEVLLKGPVEALMSPNLAVLGVTIQTDTNTTFENTAGNTINANAFFNSVSLGDLVKVKGFSSGNIIIASSVQKKDGGN